MKQSSKLKTLVMAATLGAAAMTHQSASAHDPLGQGAYPLDKIRPEVLAETDKMTLQLVNELAAKELKDSAHKALAEYIERQITLLMHAPGNEPFFKTVPNIHVHILPDREINAFATASGDIYVYLGIIPHMKHQNMLTAVLAHELIHVSRAHVPRLLDKHWDEIPHDDGKDQKQAVVTLQAWSDTLNKALNKAKDRIKKAAKDLAQNARDLARLPGIYLAIQKEKRVSETEADEMGCELLNNAGISPWYFRFAMNSLQALSRHPGKDLNASPSLEKLLTVFSDHPATPLRISDTEREIEHHGYPDYLESTGDGHSRKKDPIDPAYLKLYHEAKVELANRAVREAEEAIAAAKAKADKAQPK